MSEIARLIERFEHERQRGNAASALQVLELLQRMAPSNSWITIQIGMHRLQLGDPKASEPFELAAYRDDIREAWLGLAATRLQFGWPEYAFRELSQMLARHAPHRDSELTLTYDRIVRESGGYGWCGVTASGRIIGAVTASEEVRLTIQFDDDSEVEFASVRGSSWDLELPATWIRHRRMMVRANGNELAGSPHDLNAISHVDGFADSKSGAIEGWAWFPADPDEPVPLRISGQAPGEVLLTTAAVEEGQDVGPDSLRRARSFTVDEYAIRSWAPPVEVRGPNGRALYGSPLLPDAERASARAVVDIVRSMFPAGHDSANTQVQRFPLPAISAFTRGRFTRQKQTRRAAAIVIPVYAGREVTLACIDSVKASVGPRTRVIVVNDCSPDKLLVTELEKLKAKRQIELVVNETNRGFPASANKGILIAQRQDVVLLNSDTLVVGDWLARLRDIAYIRPEVGTVTPLSNDATIFSYPKPNSANAIPSLPELQTLDSFAARVASEPVEVPTGVGFCWYVKRDCLNDIGMLREDIFGQGYGEENDFCMRARYAGWTHMAASNVFVAHVGGHSFGKAKSQLIARNLRLLNQLHPGYDSLIAQFVARDPLFSARRSIDHARWKKRVSAAARKRSVTNRSAILVTHNREGGVLRRVQERSAMLRAEGRRVLVLTPRQMPNGAQGCHVSDGERDYANLVFDYELEYEALVRLLRQSDPEFVEYHHVVGHHERVKTLPHALGIPYDVTLHDYAWLCPQINLVSVNRRYCGEPDLPQCEACVADKGVAIERKVSVSELRSESRSYLAAARTLIAPSADAASRYGRYFPKSAVQVVPWEQELSGSLSGFHRAAPPQHRRIRACITGAIGIEKGFDILLEAARDANRRNLDLEFAIVGFTCDNLKLLDTGRISITGKFDEVEAVDLIRRQEADIGFIPSVWPETWCFTLSQMWEAGLNVAAFDIGAPADRIRARGRGWIVPLGMSAASLNDRLMEFGTSDRIAQGSTVLADAKTA